MKEGNWGCVTAGVRPLRGLCAILVSGKRCDSSFPALLLLGGGEQLLTHFFKSHIQIMGNRCTPRQQTGCAEHAGGQVPYVIRLVHNTWHCCTELTQIMKCEDFYMAWKCSLILAAGSESHHCVALWSYFRLKLNISVLSQSFNTCSYQLYPWLFVKFLQIPCRTPSWSSDPCLGT